VLFRARKRWPDVLLVVWILGSDKKCHSKRQKTVSLQMDAVRGSPVKFVSSS
jgi:hypothetical protein